MSLKLVELQVALPRTQDLGKLQEQLQQKGQLVQDHLASAQQKEDIDKRKQVNKYDETTKNRLQKDGQNSNGTYDPKKSKKQNKQMQQSEAHHPYKGNLIDIEG
jgi:hypothetical protein